MKSKKKLNSQESARSSAKALNFSTRQHIDMFNASQIRSIDNNDLGLTSNDNPYFRGKPNAVLSPDYINTIENTDNEAQIQKQISKIMQKQKGLQQKEQAIKD